MRAISVLAISIAASAAMVSAAQAAYPGRNGSIAISGQGGGRNRPDAYSYVRAVTRGGEPFSVVRCDPGGCPGVVAPAFSPNGRRIVVQYGTALAILRLDGTVVRQLRRVTSVDTRPSFAPDGRSVVFEGQAVAGGRADVYRIGVDGRGLRRLTHGGVGYKPVWSASGRIAYEHCRPPRRIAKCEVRSMLPDGRHARRVVKRAGAPAWSPDGRRLAVERYVRGIKEEGDRRTRIWLVDADGGRRARRVANRPGYAPAWSPDGRRLAFRSKHYEDGDPVSSISVQTVLTMDLRGRHSRTITSDTGFGSGFTSRPDWQPLPSGDDVTAAAVIERLVHHSEILALKGDSYRLKDPDLVRATPID